MLRIMLIIIMAILLVGCGPEDGRPRGGGLGASGTNIPAEGVEPGSKLFSEREP